MASKMPAALDDNNKKITVSVAENSACVGSLKCEFCEANVSFVNGYTREVGDKKVPVSPFFRLKTGSNHSLDCKYNTEAQITVIARESEPSILRQTESGKFELRVLAVKKAIQDLKKIAEEKKSGKQDANPEVKEKNYVKSEERLGSYINSALRVLKVRAACEENSEIEGLLELVFDGNRLPWKDFYYEDKDYFRCYSNLMKCNSTIPVAIVGVVKTIRDVSTKNGSFTVINFYSQYKNTNSEEILDAANVSIWTPDTELFKKYKVDDVLLAFGVWIAKKVIEKKNTSTASTIEKFRNHELMLWPINKSQISIVAD